MDSQYEGENDANISVQNWLNGQQNVQFEYPRHLQFYGLSYHFDRKESIILGQIPFAPPLARLRGFNYIH